MIPFTHQRPPTARLPRRKSPLGTNRLQALFGFWGLGLRGHSRDAGTTCCGILRTVFRSGGHNGGVRAWGVRA